jgi:membrane-associated protease RseP (regulator of RpoE activity)
MRVWPLRRRRALVPTLPSDDLLVIGENLRRAVENVVSVRERQLRGSVIVFRGDLKIERARALDELLARWRPFGYTPFLRAERDGVMVQAWPLTIVEQEPRRVLALVLFSLTVMSSFFAGAAFFVGSPTFDAFRAMRFPGWLLSGTPFAVTLLAILGVHELGHYFTARFYRASVSLPYFIPLPPLYVPGLGLLFTTGTLGAVIRLRSPARDRNSLFDIAAAGPLAGLLVAVPALIVGLSWSQVVPGPATAGFGGFGYSLLTRLFVYLQFGSLADGTMLLTHPMADAAWVGCFVTALNLIPVGQLDGGRIAYALSARRHRALGVVTWVVLLLMGVVTGSPNWFMWAALLFLLIGFDHSPSLDEIAPLTPVRRLVGIGCLALFVLLVPPIPMPLPT